MDNNTANNNDKILKMIFNYFATSLEGSAFRLYSSVNKNNFHISIEHGNNWYLIHKNPSINDGHLTFVFNNNGYKLYSNFKINYDADNLLDAIGEINMEKLTQIAYGLIPFIYIKSSCKK